MKFNVTDENGEEYSVEEIEHDDPVATPNDEEASLSPDDIAALKELAAVASQLIALVDKPADNTVGDEGEEEEGEEEEGEEVEEEEGDVVVDTKDFAEHKKVGDAKKSIGSIEKPVSLDDSVEDAISNAWAKRYNGGK